MNEEAEQILIEIALEKLKQDREDREDQENREQEEHKTSIKDYGGWFAGTLGLISMVAAVFINFYDMKSELNLQKNQIAELIIRNQVIDQEEKEIIVLKERIRNILENCEIKPPKNKP